MAIFHSYVKLPEGNMIPGHLPLAFEVAGKKSGKRRKPAAGSSGWNEVFNLEASISVCVKIMGAPHPIRFQTSLPKIQQPELGVNHGKPPLFSHFFGPKYHMVRQHLYPLEMVGSLPPLSVTNAEKVTTTWISPRRFGRDTPKKYLSIWISRISWCCVG